MNYYQFHIADWTLHTAHLTLEEEAVYRRLLDYYYDTESPIPEKTQPVIRRLRLGSYEETVASILDEFFTLKADGWHNLRADREIIEYNAKAEIARANGKKGGRPKKQKQENQQVAENQNPQKTQPVISGNPEKTGSKANQEPRTINQKPNSNTPPPPQRGRPKRKAKSRLPDDFTLTDDRFNRAASYWHRKGRSDLCALTEFDKFANHHRAKGSTMADWDAAWQTWYSNAITFNRQPNRPNGETASEFLASRSDKSWAAGLIPHNPGTES